MKKVAKYLPLILLFCSGCSKAALDSVPFPDGEVFKNESVTESQWQALNVVGSAWQLGAYYHKKQGKWEEKKNVDMTYDFFSSDSVRVSICTFSLNPHSDGEDIVTEVNAWSFDASQSTLTIGTSSFSVLDARADSFYLLQDLFREDVFCVGQYKLGKLVRR